jgi:hypothetical protein
MTSGTGCPLGRYFYRAWTLDVVGHATNWARPADIGADDAVRTEVEREVLTPRSVEYVLDSACASGIRARSRHASETRRA